MVTASPSDSGLLLVDKPQGVTSHDVVAAVRSTLHMRKVGHAGTLDPMATGMLVIGFGYGTRLLAHLVNHDKTYEATIRLGQASDTDDADGTLLAVPDGVSERMGRLVGDGRRLRQRLQDEVNRRFLGPIEQVPSAFSAIKVNGRRAYDLVREGKDVSLASRRVTIDSYDVIRACGLVTGGGSVVVDVRVRISCSSGTYIRALARDLGEALAVGGHLTELRRTRVGRFLIDDPHVITARRQIRSVVNREGIAVQRGRAIVDGDATSVRAHALSLFDSVRRSMGTVSIDESQARDLRHGRRITADIAALSAAYVQGTADVVGLVEPADAGQARPVAVFAV